MTPSLFSWSAKNRSRKSDPDTSREAAKAVTDKGGTLKPSQIDVLHILKQYRTATQKTLENTEDLQRNYSPSRIRSAVSELVRMGIVVDSGQRERLESGRKAIVWRMA